MHQSKTLAGVQKELAAARHEGDDLSVQMWRLLEENCNVNKRILQLDMEVHSLEELLTRAKYDLEEAEQKSDTHAKKMEAFRAGYEKKSREVIEIGTRERNLQAMVINLGGELDQWKRNSQWNVSTNEEIIIPNTPLNSLSTVCSNCHDSSAVFFPPQQGLQSVAAGKSPSCTLDFPLKTPCTQNNNLPIRNTNGHPPEYSTHQSVCNIATLPGNNHNTTTNDNNNLSRVRLPPETNQPP